MMRSKPSVILSAVALATFAVQPGGAPAGTNAQVERQVLQRVPIEGTDEELQMMLVTFPPGSQSQPHVHPVPGMNYIVAGTAESQYEGHPLERFKAGDSYLDLASVTHTVFRNPSRTEPLKFIIAYKIKKGVPFKQDLSSRPGS